MNSIIKYAIRTRYDVYICQINKSILNNTWFSIPLSTPLAPGWRQWQYAKNRTAAQRGWGGGVAVWTLWISGPFEQPCPRWVVWIYSAKRVGNFQGLEVSRKRKKKKREKLCDFHHISCQGTIAALTGLPILLPTFHLIKDRNVFWAIFPLQGNQDVTNISRIT